MRVRSLCAGLERHRDLRPSRSGTTGRWGACRLVRPRRGAVGGGGTETDFLEDTPLQVLVRDNNVDQALRVLKKKMQREGIFREMKQRKAYEKPSVRKAREKAEAVRRARKQARKTAIREGLIAAPKPKPRAVAPRRPAAPAPASTPVGNA